MNSDNGSFSNAKDSVEKLIELKIDKFRLQSTDSLARLFSKILVAFIIILLVGILTGFITIAIAIWIGEMLHSLALGMLCSAVIVALIVLIVFLKRDTLFLDSMTRLFIKLIFPNDNTKE